MAMAKINISLPDGLLDDVDELAGRLKRSRSGLIQEATAEYVARLHEEQAAEERRRDISRARRDLEALGKELPAFDGTAAIRWDRDHGHRDGTSK
jgi:metal-responsive CopG/Arc/MetJ family transcriptional regulator